jgi:hypothetical protein
MTKRPTIHRGAANHQPGDQQRLRADPVPRRRLRAVCGSRRHLLRTRPRSLRLRLLRVRRKARARRVRGSDGDLRVIKQRSARLHFVCNGRFCIAGSPQNKGGSSAGEGSRTPMSFRTDGFEPSAYTIPPPRPGAHDQTSRRRRPPSPIILPQSPLAKSIQCSPRVTRIWLKCPRDWREQPGRRRHQDTGRRRRG